MIYLQLGRTFFDCPPAWRNFVQHHNEDYSVDEWRNRSVEILNKELRKYNAYRPDYPDSTRFGPAKVEFETEPDLTMFLLKWS